MPQIKLIISILIILFTFNSCKKDCKCQDPSKPECENYDPCYGKRTPNFGFTYGSQWVTEEYFFGIKNYVHDKDSLIQNNNRIKFTANKIYDSVVWKLGQETIFEKSFVRLFNEVPEGYYQCQMIGLRPKQSCILNDDGIDTVIKRWYMMPIPKLPIMGKFKVLFDGYSDSSIVEVLPWETYRRGIPPLPYKAFYTFIQAKDVNTGYVTLVNFLNDGDTTASNELNDVSQVYSGQWIVFNDNATIIPNKGYFHLNQDNKVEAKFINGKINSSGKVEYKTYSFKGRKIK